MAILNEQFRRMQKLAGIITEERNPFVDTDDWGYMRVYIDDVVKDSMDNPEESLDLKYRNEFDIAFNLALAKLKKDEPELDFKAIEANKELFWHGY